jgi:hypothetical protein
MQIGRISDHLTEGLMCLSKRGATMLAVKLPIQASSQNSTDKPFPTVMEIEA